MHIKNAKTPMKLIFLSIVIVAVCVLLLGVKVLFVRGGRFPSGHAHDIPALRSRGVTCASGVDHNDRNKNKINHQKHQPAK